jgi:hypothetical protein
MTNHTYGLMRESYALCVPNEAIERLAESVPNWNFELVRWCCGLLYNQSHWRHFCFGDCDE